MTTGKGVEHEIVDTDSALADAAFVEDLRLQMLKFASLQLKDSALAEDAVQEAFIGALKSAGSFGGRAALRTWVFAILKNKIADVLRQNQRLITASSLIGDDDELGEAVSSLFDKRGFWRAQERPVSWGDPEHSLHDGQFWNVFAACLDDLPPKHARVFMMREFVELDSGEICHALGISVSNLHVLLHRARMRLRHCLEHKWYSQGAQSC